MKVEVELNGYQIEKLDEVIAYAAENGEEMDAARALVVALMRVKVDGALRAPIYQSVYVVCKEDDDGAFPVNFVGGEAEWDDWLRKISFAEAFELRKERPLTPIYVRVEHEVEYPYAAVDCTEIIAEEKKQFFGEIISDWGPRQFCRATFAATPQMHLIG